MRKLIRSKNSKLFLTTDGQWTGDPKVALQVPGFSQAMAAVERFQLTHVELYYCYRGDALSRRDLAIVLYD
jgi:hypothetical protein